MKGTNSLIAFDALDTCRKHLARIKIAQVGACCLAFRWSRSPHFVQKKSQKKEKKEAPNPRNRNPAYETEYAKRTAHVAICRRWPKYKPKITYSCLSYRRTILPDSGPDWHTTYPLLSRMLSLFHPFRYVCCASVQSGHPRISAKFF